MTTIPPLTRDIGQAERAMGALLERQIEGARLSFVEWTALVHLDVAGPLTPDELVRRQVNGRVASEAEARAAAEGLLSRGLIALADGGDTPLVLTDAGEAVYRPVRRTVGSITDGLYGDLPPGDLEATHRTLAEIKRRADARLAAGG